MKKHRAESCKFSPCLYISERALLSVAEDCTESAQDVLYVVNLGSSQKALKASTGEKNGDWAVGKEK